MTPAGPVFHWRESLPGVEWGVTSRLGGVSEQPFDSLNLGGAVGDRPGDVAANRALVAGSFELPHERLLFARQCHGSDVGDATGPWAGAAPAVDALVTTATDVALGVLVADCVPVLLVDRTAGVAAAVHAGRQGLLAGVVPAALDAMRRRGAAADRIQAVVGPSVCGRCYEVPAELAREVMAAVPLAAARSWTGTPALDLAAGVLSQLRDGEVAAPNLRLLPGCTRESPDLYSYRRDRDTGRFAAVVRLVPVGSADPA